MVIVWYRIDITFLTSYAYFIAGAHNHELWHLRESH